jgi:hypothetical protein
VWRQQVTIIHIEKHVQNEFRDENHLTTRHRQGYPLVLSIQWDRQDLHESDEAVAAIEVGEKKIALELVGERYRSMYFFYA